jgi:alkanesulfonate monooxygenase SsuD/methylene tetrahydromethanopterin reductase-like flavin-dependent oxidoreductase (luciferase family)
MANAAMDVDELSGGRLLLGIGPGGAGWAEFFHGNDVDKPVTRMREYIDILRLGWHHLATGEPSSYHGKIYRFETPPANPFGLRRDVVRERIPIVLSGLRAKMAQLAGEKADGFLGYIVTPQFIRDIWKPNIAAGALQAGRNPAEIETTALVLCSVSDDRKKAFKRARINVGMYLCTPAGELVAGHMGMKEERDAVMQALMSRGPQALETAVSDALVGAFSIVGTPDEAREQYTAYRDVLDHVVLHTPYVPPLTESESEDAFRNTVRTFGVSQR